MTKAANYRHFVGDSLGGPEVFSLQQGPVPRPGPGELLLQVKALGLGFVDLLLVQGKYQLRPDTPFVPGGEIVGVVREAGPEVEGFAVGTMVSVWQTGGGAADMAIVTAKQAVRLPETVPDVDAAAIMLDFLTARYALFDRGGLRQGETVLVLGAAGGVGAAAVQLATRAGARVIAGASSHRKREHALRLGAVAAVDTSLSDWREKLKILIAKSGLDVVVDPVGGRVFEPAFRSLSKHGRHLVIGFASGEIPRLPANLTLLKSASLIGVDVRHYVYSAPESAHAALTELMHEAATRPFDRTARTVFALKDIQQAFAALGDRERIGKIVIVP